MPKRLLSYANVFWKAAKRLDKEQFTYRASALAFATLLAIVPLLSVIVSLISIFPIFNRFTVLAQNYIFTNFIPTSSNLIQKYLLAFINQANRLPTLSIVFLLFTVITLFIMVDHTPNTIWGTPKRHKKLPTLSLYLLILMFTPVFIGISLVLSTYLFSLSWISGATTQLGIKIPILASLPLAINTLIFSALYIVVPNIKVPWRSGIIGGLIASLLFEAAKKGFAFYLKHFPSYELIYGTMATIPIFLIWVYISWLIILYGALISHAISQTNRSHNIK